LDVTEDSYVDTCYWHYVCCTNWQTWILTLTLHSIGKLCDMNGLAM
jgi:hypothetical protein